MAYKDFIEQKLKIVNTADKQSYYNPSIIHAEKNNKEWSKTIGDSSNIYFGAKWRKRDAVNWTFFLSDYQPLRILTFLRNLQNVLDEK